jgi:ABC-type enterochelin transport system permease subunit
MKRDLRDEVLERTARLINLLAQGRAPRQLAPLLAGASLSAAPKKVGASALSPCAFASAA